MGTKNFLFADDGLRLMVSNTMNFVFSSALFQGRGEESFYSDLPISLLSRSPLIERESRLRLRNHFLGTYFCNYEGRV